MNKSFLKIMLFIIIICNGCEHPNVDKNKSNADYNNNARMFWEKILEQDQDTVDYIINWIKDNPDIEGIYFSHPDNKVEFIYDSGTLFDVDKCVTDFIKQNDIHLSAENGKIIFSHDFYYKEGDIYGVYTLDYIEHDDNADERDFKLKENFYYNVYFGE